MTAVQKPTGHISREIKVAAVELFKAGITRANICKQLRISIKSLYLILKAFQKNPLNPDLERKKGTGRKKVISPETLVTMKRLLSDTPTLTAKALKNKVPALQSVAIRTIQEACQKDLGLPSRKMAKKPLIKDRMKAQRLEFALQYQHWTVEEWKKVMFCDESHFELMAGDRVGRCRRPKGSDRFHPKFTKKTVKHPAKIMVWGCFSWQGRGGLEFLKKGEMMDGPRYRRLIDEKLELFMNQHQTTHFLQDGAPCHRSRIVTAWFQDRPHITLIKWPGNSPDLNPIENAWDWMKDRLAENTPRASSVEELKRQVAELWTLRMGNSAYLRNLVESMPRRLQDVIERDGGMTKY